MYIKFIGKFDLIFATWGPGRSEIFIWAEDLSIQVYTEKEVPYMGYTPYTVKSRLAIYEN